jgi:glycosyltransferase involved in cell wall biosynthesis
MITVVLPVRNVGGIIEECLSGVTWADEVLLADGNSTDKTLEIAARFPNVRVIQHPSSDIRVVVSDTEPQARNPWIFWLCADEIVTPELGKEIQERCAAAGPGISGFWVPSRDVQFGVKWDSGEPWPRIWRKGRAKFAMKQMHEMPVIQGEMPSLTHFFWHVNNPNIRTLIPKFLRYQYVDTQNASDEQCARVNVSFWVLLMRFCYHAVKWYWPRRKSGYPGVAWSMCAAFSQVTRHLLLAEELRIRQGLTKRDSHGWG